MTPSHATRLFENLLVLKKGPCFELHRDNKPLKTPAGALFRLPTERLAEAVADEWRAQKDKIVPATMPMTQLAATALDVTARDRENAVTQIVAYSASELLCHRADVPEALAKKQQEVWQPLLDWCAVRFGALLRPGIGIMPVPQTSEAARALYEAIAAHDDFFLTGLSHAVNAAGSLVLGLALSEGERTAAEVFKAAELDSLFQALAWGTDPATESRHASVLRDLESCERWFRLLRE